MEYYLDPTQLYRYELTTSPGMNPVMQILEEVFDPTGTQLPTFKDCVLISLDAEYDSRACKVSQIGLASLDTRQIAQADEDSKLTTGVLSSRLLLLERQRADRGSYLFGTPDQCHDQDIATLLRSVFTIADTATRQNRNRNIILVGHSIRNDIKAISRSINFDILALPTIKAIVDTSPLLHTLYHTPGRCHSLRTMCTTLGMYKRNMHNAGNDAMYTLKALLLIFDHYNREKIKWSLTSGDRAELYSCQLEAIRRIGRCNNGVGRFAQQRRRRQKGTPLRQRDKSVQHHDLLASDHEEEAMMDGLFLTRTELD